MGLTILTIVTMEGHWPFSNPFEIFWKDPYTVWTGNQAPQQQQTLYEQEKVVKFTATI